MKTHKRGLHLPNIFILLAILTLLVSSFQVNPVQAQAGGAAEMIAAVNALRASHNLSAYTENSILMGTAQGQADYMASTGVIDHAGPGGSRPKDRAIAAGYGGGQTIFLSENIVGGTNLTVDQAVSSWQQDDPHLNTMLGPNYKDIGAGVATGGDYVYYVIDVGYVAGGSSAAKVVGTPADTPTVQFVNPVQTVTPNPDGSIIHVVKYGQTLYTIALAYNTTINAIKNLNKLTSNNIYEGQKLTIRLASTPTPTGLYTNTPTKTVTPLASLTQTVTTTPKATNTSVALPSETPTATQPGMSALLSGSTQVPTILLIIGGLVFLGMVLMITGMMMRRKV